MLQQYLPIIYVLLVVLAVLFILLLPTKKNALERVEKPKNDTSHTITRQDIKAIAGEDEIITQLDLARAYIEMGKKKMAQQLLQHVTQHGTATQQQEARQLLETV